MKIIIIQGKLWEFQNIWFDEIMQLIYIKVKERYVFKHSRRQGDDKYSIKEKKLIIAISLETPQVANILKEKTMKEAITEVKRIWVNYLNYALSNTATNLISFRPSYYSIKLQVANDKLTKEELIKELGVSIEEYDKQIEELNPYK